MSRAECSACNGEGKCVQGADNDYDVCPICGGDGEVCTVLQDQRFALMYGDLALCYIRRGEADNAALLTSRAAHYAARYALTPEWRRERGGARLLWAIIKGWDNGKL